MLFLGTAPVGGNTEMIEYREVLLATGDRAAALKGEGKSLNETVTAKPTAYDAKWGKGFVTGEVFSDWFTKVLGMILRKRRRTESDH